MTNRSDIVVFVSAGMLSPKKRDHILARRQLYLNYGALSLATKLNLSGYKTILVHGEHYSPDEVFESMLAQECIPSQFPIMLSIPSFYALPWAQAFSKLIKREHPDCRLVVGGRWVVGADPVWFRAALPEADQLVPGLGESIIFDLISGSNSISLRPKSASPTPEYTLNHRLVLGHDRYQPSIEVSRGCGMGCKFCEERDIPLERLRSPQAVAESMRLIQEQYDGAKIHPYMQASLFAANKKWSDQLAGAVVKNGLRVAWRMETRVDAMRRESIPSLAEAGLKVIDLGLETASPTQLLAMNKTRHPDRYLRSASELVSACRDNGVMVKANVLLYPGETERTLLETRSWLDDHSAGIRGVSVGPVVAYGPPATASILLIDWASRGARPVNPQSAADTGITSVHLSHDIDGPSAERISLELSRRYMDADAYFELKAFSYYPRGYSREAFDADVRASSPASLPFEARL